jgi:hypothetical protein
LALTLLAVIVRPLGFPSAPLFCAAIALPALVPAAPELLDKMAFVVGMVARLVAVALEAADRVAAAEDELVIVTHGSDCAEKVM